MYDTITRPDQIIDSALGIYKVPMQRMRELVNSPFDWAPWGCDPITAEEVLAVPAEEYEADMYEGYQLHTKFTTREYHLRRVAHLLNNFDSDPYYLPRFSVAKHVFDEHSLVDGNHRYAAAIIRGDEFFTVRIEDVPEEGVHIFGVLPETL